MRSPKARVGRARVEAIPPESDQRRHRRSPRRPRARPLHAVDGGPMSERCRLCGRSTVERLIEFGAHPIAHQFLQSPDEDEYTHPVTLGFCAECGLVQLIDPIPPERLYT